MRKSNYKGILVICALFIIGMSVNFIIVYSDKIIEKHKKLAPAYIVSVEMFTKPNIPRIKYFYIVGHDTLYYAQYVEFSVDFEKLKALEGKILMVKYDSTNIKSSRLILDENDIK